MKNIISITFAVILIGLIHPLKIKGQIFSVKAGTDFDVKANTIITADSIDFLPSINFKINGNDFFRNNSVISSISIPTINRAYYFSSTTNNFNGSIKMHYSNNELNNLNEISLQFLFNNGTSWSLDSNSNRDTIENFIENTSIIGLSLKEISAGSSGSIGCIPSTSNVTIAACSTYLWNGVTYSTSGTKTWIGTNALGCDSVVTLS